MPPSTIEEYFRRRTVAAENANAALRIAAPAAGLRNGTASSSGSGNGVRNGCDVDEDGGQIGSAMGRSPSQVLQDLVNRNSRSRKGKGGLGLRRRRGNMVVREYEVHGRLPPWASSRVLTAALLLPTYRPVHEVVVENLDLLFDYSSWNRQPDSARDVSSMEFNCHGDMLLCSHRCGLVGFVSAAEHLHRLWHESAITADAEDDAVASPPRRDPYANAAGEDEEAEHAERHQHQGSLERDWRGERRRGSEEDGRSSMRAAAAPEAAASAFLSRQTALKPAHVVHFGAHDVDRARWCPTDETKVACVGSTSSSVRVMDVADFSPSSMRWEVLAQQGNAHSSAAATHGDPLRNPRHGLKDVAFFPAASGHVRGLAALRRDGVVLVWDRRVHSTRGSSSSGGGSSSSSGGPAHGKHAHTSSGSSSNSKRQQQPVLQLEAPTDDLQQRLGTTTCIEVSGEGLFVNGGTTRGLVHTWDVRGGSSGGTGNNTAPSSASSGFTFLNKALGLLPVNTLNVNPISSNHATSETSAVVAAGTGAVLSSSAVQSLSLCPDDTSKLAFHLHSGVAGVVDLKYAQVACSAAPLPPPTAAASSSSEPLSPTPNDRFGVGSSSSSSNRSFYGRGLAHPSPIGLPWLNGGGRDVSIGRADDRLWTAATIPRRGCWLPSSPCFVCPSAHQPLLGVFDFGHRRCMALPSTVHSSNVATRQTHHNAYSTLALDCDSAASAAEAASANTTAVSVAAHPRHWQILAGMQSGVVLVLDSVARR